jgi:hypothetical protein
VAEEPEQLRWDAVLMDWWVEGALTSTCRTSSDCPDGTVCVDAGRRLAPGEVAASSSGGDCMQACDPAAPAGCLFCGWTCGEGGYCAPESPPLVGPPCVADCQCPQPWNLCSAWDGTGRCGLGGAPFGRTLYCLPGGGGNCACRGGTCEMIPDGNIGCCHTPEGELMYRLDDPRRDEVCGEFAP